MSLAHCTAGSSLEEEVRPSPGEPGRLTNMHNGFPRCALVKLKGNDLAHEKGLENWQPAQETNFTDVTKPSLGFCLGHGNLAFSEEKPILAWKFRCTVQRGRGKPDTSGKNR